jgi:ABC-type transport system involved in cytochrome bd biosynthesis fused ATPase/permease subunit
VQEKPQESEGYFDYDMKKGHIIGTDCEFGINDNYHLEIIRKLKKADAISDVRDGKLDVYAAMEKIKQGLDDKKVEEKNCKLQNTQVNPQFADTTTIFNQANFEVQAGEKICICGAEDDGKSMFLFSILGETELVHGNLKMNGALGLLSIKRGAFVGGTVRDNITLFSRFQKDLYAKACSIAELNTARMPGDDFMQVSDSGGNLFAKEKLQIMVARLIYQNADIFIIDDFFDLMTKQNRGSYSASIMKHCTETQKTLLYVSAYENMVK